MAHKDSTLKAALWMGGWLALLLIMAVAGRETASELHVLQVMEVRSIIGLVLLMPLVSMNGGLAAMRTTRPGAHIARNVVHYVGQGLWFYALALIPLAEMISIEFTTPFWTALLAVFFLGERLGLAKIIAIALGVIGVVVIVRPGAATMDVGHIAVLAAAMTFGVSIVLVKSLTRTDSVVAIIFWMLVIQSVIGLIPALMVWQTPSPGMWLWLVVIAAAGSFSHFCMAKALAYADATVVVPMDFLRVPLMALVGYLVYSEQIDLITGLGAVLILAGNVLNLFDRPAQAREEIPPSP